MLRSAGFILQNYTEPIMAKNNQAPEISRNIITGKYLFGLEMYFETE